MTAGPATEPQPLAVGREAELAHLRAFLTDPVPGTLVITGPAGIGKTTLWQEAIDSSRRDGRRVLATRASESELPLSFAGLSDLLAGVEIGDFVEVPEPQRHALEVVLYRRQAAGAAPDLSAAALGLAGLLRALAMQQPLLVAVDDVGWLDRASLSSLAFAGRRLADSPIKLLLTRRPGSRSYLEGIGALHPLEQLELEGLTLGATRLLLGQRLGLRLPRRLLRRLHQLANGNPLLALELGRDPVWQDGLGAITAPAARGDELFGERIAGLTPPLRRALLAVALSPGLSEPEVAVLLGPAFESALTAGLLCVNEHRVQPAHPLLAAAARGRSSAKQRQALHLELAGVVSDRTRRLHHAALGATEPDAALASELVDNAAIAFAHGALDDAVELTQHALRLTRPDDQALPERLLYLAELLLAAGELSAVAKLLERRISQLPAGPWRARAHLLLGETATFTEHEQHLDQALAHAGTHQEIVAAAHASRAVLLLLNRVVAVDNAASFASDALVAARTSGLAEAEARAVHALAWARILQGRPIEDLGGSGRRSGLAASLYESAVERPTAVRLIWRGQLDESRHLLDRLLELAEERGEARSCVVLHLHRCELELRAGEVRAAATSLEAWEEWVTDEADADVETIRGRCRALLAALEGCPADARRWADAAEAANAESGFVWDRLEILRARGLAALYEGEPARATAALLPVWQHTLREGIQDPGAFPVAADLVEALIALTRDSEAAAVSNRLEMLAREQHHPWALVTTRRCLTLLQVARRHDHDTLAALEDVAAEYSRLGLRFDAARTLLAAARAMRRQRRWRIARELLQNAATVFDDLGAEGWATLARNNISRSTNPRPGGLTAAEQRVARLAANGRSNKEIAASLVISASTVETHLKKIYRKLGINSRAQLSTRLAHSERSST